VFVRLIWIGGPLDGHVEERSQGVKHVYVMEVVDTGIFEHCYLSDKPVGPGVDEARLYHTEVVKNECGTGEVEES
tara:strand:- start:224 stop:448 length:225 start_codon:yes stop_codon:yes gene_type:complete